MNDSRFSNGFLLGLIVGGGAIFLFGTKTGKKLIKTMTEEGFEGVKEYIDEELEEKLEDFAQGQEQTSNHEESGNHQGSEPQEEEIKKPARRKFFKRSS